MHTAFTLAAGVPLLSVGPWRFVHFMDSLDESIKPRGECADDLFVWLCVMRRHFGWSFLFQSVLVATAGALVIFGPVMIFIVQSTAFPGQ